MKTVTTFRLVDFLNLLFVVVIPCTGVVYPVADPCRDMKILFWGEPCTKPCPFILTAGQSVIKAGEKISATISSNDATPYVAFLLQARRENGESFGDFKQTSNITIYSCHTGQFDMVTNKDFKRKVKNILYWISPKDLVGNVTVQFVLTIMKGQNEYWTGVKSNEFTVIGSNVTSTASTKSKFFSWFRFPSWFTIW